MTVKKLSDIPFETIIACFLKAFDNYFVELPQDKEYYRQRWKAAKVDFGSSYGMFEGEKMAGFILHAIDTRNNRLTAFNTGTGVIPEYRGKRIIHSIYTYALNDLKAKNIELSTLEVITQNDIAIKAYERIGFRKCKEYKCFNGKIQLDTTEEVVIKEIDINDVDWNDLPNQELYSWDNQKESILAGNYRFFYVMHQNQPESFFIINTEINYVAQLGLLKNEHSSWQRLFAGIKQVSESIKINNVDHRLKEKLDALTSVGLKNTVDQFEMELKITNG